MSKPKRLFYDNLIHNYSKDLTLEEMLQYSASFSKDSRVAYIHFTNLLRKSLLEVLESSTVFLINGAIADDLYHIPADFTNYESVKHLPFPIIFFELTDAIPFERKKNEFMNLKAIIFGKGKEASQTLKVAYKKNESLDIYCVSLFYSPMSKFDMPDELFIGPEEFDKLNSSECVVYEALFQKKEISDSISKESLFNITNFCINVIDFINARNITLRLEERQDKNLDKINRRRINKGKKILKPLKPYYWVDIKQHFSSPKKQESESKMEYREWVRGHFERYHTKEGIKKIWVQPYVRGPENKPWKENRYKILDEILKRGPKG